MPWEAHEMAISGQAMPSAAWMLARGAACRLKFRAVRGQAEADDRPAGSMPRQTVSRIFLVCSRLFLAGAECVARRAGRPRRRWLTTGSGACCEKPWSAPDCAQAPNFTRLGKPHAYWLLGYPALQAPFHEPSSPACLKRAIRCGFQTIALFTPARCVRAPVAPRPCH